MLPGPVGGLSRIRLTAVALPQAGADGRASKAEVAAERSVAGRICVVVQGVLEGMQEVRVQAVMPLAGPGHGQIAIRVGRLCSGSWSNR